MIQAEKAQRIMQQYESDYDNFLDKLKAKLHSKKSDAGKAGKTLSEAQAHKKVHLGEKAKGLIDKAGGIEGAKSTIQNVMKYFKTDAPSDYEVGVGSKGDEPSDKNKTGIPPVVLYVGGGLLLLGVIYAASQVIKKNKGNNSQQVAGDMIPEQTILQQAA